MKIFTNPKFLVNVAIKTISKVLPLWVTSLSHVKENTGGRYVYTMPVNIHELPVIFAEQFDREIIIKPHRIYYLFNVCAAWQGVIFKNFKIFIPSLMAPSGVEYFQEPLLLKQWFGKTINFNESDGLAIVHNQYAPHNYYHWIVDSLPRLLLLKEFHPTAPLLFPQNPASYIVKTAEVFGFNNFIYLNPKEIVRAEKIILPDEHAAPVGHNDPVLIRQVKRILLDNFGLPEIKKSKRVYLSRERQKLRKAHNQSELDTLLLKYDFEKVYFEGMTLSQQIQIMQEATVVLGVHGANMVNCIFIPEGTPVIEMQSVTLTNPAYWRLCSILSLPYYCLACLPIIDEPISTHSNVDIIIDLEKLEAIFTKLGL